MAFFIRKKKHFNSSGHFISGDARLPIHSLIQTQRQTLQVKSVKLTRILSRKYICYRTNDYSKKYSLSCVEIWKDKFRSTLKSQRPSVNAKGKVLQTISRTASLRRKLQLQIEKALFKTF